MAFFDISLTGGTNSTRFNGRLLYGLNSQNAGANTSNVVLYAQILSNNASYSFNGYNNNGQLYAGGSQVASGNYTGTVNTSPQVICSWTGDVTHDVNGNLNLDIQIGVQSGYAGSGSSGPFGWALPRIPLAPSISSVVASLIKPTAATITTSISSNGHGTSTTVTTYYRLQGAGSWTSAGTGTVKSLTGLKPGKTYEFYSNATNNNGDSVDSGSSTFKTKGVAGFAPILMALLQG